MNVNVTQGELFVLRTRHSVNAIIRQSHVPCLHTYSVAVNEPVEKSHALR